IDCTTEAALGELEAQVAILEVADDETLVEAAELVQEPPFQHHAGGGDGAAAPEPALRRRPPALALVDREQPAAELRQLLEHHAHVLHRAILEEQQWSHGAEV